MMTAKRRGLGKGKLGRGEGSVGDRKVAKELLRAAAAEVIEEIPVAAIDPNPWQCRLYFDEGALHVLAEDIARTGLIHEVVVRRVESRYQLAAGERRTRAMRLLGRTTIPARVHDYSDRQMRRIAWAENYERAGLSAWEQAQAVLGAQQGLKQAGEECHQRAVATELGLSLGTVNEFLRIARAFPAEAVKHAQSDLPEEADVASGSERWTIHDIPRADLVRAAKNETDCDAWLRRRLTPATKPAKATRAPQKKYIRVPRDLTSVSGDRARDLAVELFAILPALLGNNDIDDADARAVAMAGVKFCFDSLDIGLLQNPQAAAEPQIGAWEEQIRAKASRSGS